MVKVGSDNIPEYLRNGALFSTLFSADVPLVEVPDDCLKENTQVHDDADLSHLLRTITYWQCSVDTQYRQNVLDYLVVQDKLSAKLKASLELYTTVMPVLNDILATFGPRAKFHEKRFSALDRASKFDCLSVVKELSSDSGWEEKDRAFKCALSGDSLSVVEYFCDQSLISLHACIEAARWGSLRCLKHIVAKGYMTDKYIGAEATHAAQYGHYECLAYLHEIGCMIPPEACEQAAENGHLQCLQFIHEQGWMWSDRATDKAAAGGHLECLKYLHEHGCPWGRACEFAARGGHLECLKYAHEHGCSWDARCGMSGNHLEILQYLHENGCPWNEYAIINAAVHNHMECLVYLHEIGCPWGRISGIFVEQLVKGSTEGVKYALEHGCPVDEPIRKLVEDSDRSSKRRRGTN